MLTRKRVYPYDYIDNFEKFKDPLPLKEEFYSKFNDSEISDKDL